MPASVGRFFQPEPWSSVDLLCWNLGNRSLVAKSLFPSLHLLPRTLPA